MNFRVAYCIYSYSPKDEMHWCTRGDMFLIQCNAVDCVFYQKRLRVNKDNRLSYKYQKKLSNNSDHGLVLVIV